MLLYAVTIFLSAFLLFQVQPLIAKIILPWFGGSAAVWSAAMMFFQLSLLAGYGYAHFLGKAKAKARSAIWLERLKALSRTRRRTCSRSKDRRARSRRKESACSLFCDCRAGRKNA